MNVSGSAAVRMHSGGYTGAKTLQHEFRMIPGQRRISHGSLSISVEPREKDGRLDLGRGYRRLVGNAAKMARLNLKRSAAIVIDAGNVSPHAV